MADDLVSTNDLLPADLLAPHDATPNARPNEGAKREGRARTRRRRLRSALSPRHGRQGLVTGRQLDQWLLRQGWRDRDTLERLQKRGWLTFNPDAPAQAAAGSPTAPERGGR